MAWPAASYRRFYRSHPQWWSTSPSGGWIPGDFPIDVSAYFINSSTDNHWHTSDAKRRRGKQDVGSNWTAVKTQAEIEPFFVNFRSSHAGGVRGYKGFTFVADWYNVDFGKTEAEYAASTEAALYGYGATAINRCLPTSPIVDLPVAVGELLTEGLPNAIGGQFLRNRRVTSDELSSEYLNYSFGVKPFLNDMDTFSKALKKAEAIIEEYAANSGKIIRRGYRFPTEISTTATPVSNNSGYRFHFAGLGQSTAQGFMTPVLGGWPGDRVDTTTTRKSRWFKGAFTYYLPGTGKDFSTRLAREVAEMRHLYGGLSISTAWNLLPFSWAADWITNAGDVIENIDAFARDGLVMPWGYIMEHNEIHVDRKVRGARIGQQVSDSNYRFPLEVHTSYSSHYMRRRKATPYGFGLDTAGFSSRQWSILSALGIQHSLR